MRRPLTHSRRITVLGVQPHSGRVTTTVVLGSLFVALRERATLALDGAPTAGDLHVHLPPDASSTPRRLTRLAPDAPYEAIRRHTSVLPSGLEVLAHRALRATPSPAYADEYRHIMALVTRHYPVVLTDWAAHRLDASTDVALEHTDRLVVCCTPRQGSTLAGPLIEELRERGWGNLADGAVVAEILTSANASPAYGGQAQRQADTVVVPYDTHLSQHRPIDLTRLKSRTANAFLDLAARVMTDPEPIA